MTYLLNMSILRGPMWAAHTKEVINRKSIFLQPSPQPKFTFKGKIKTHWRLNPGLADFKILVYPLKPGLHCILSCRRRLPLYQLLQSKCELAVQNYSYVTVIFTKTPTPGPHPSPGLCKHLSNCFGNVEHELTFQIFGFEKLWCLLTSRHYDCNSSNFYQVRNGANASNIYYY